MSKTILYIVLLLATGFAYQNDTQDMSKSLKKEDTNEDDGDSGPLSNICLRCIFETIAGTHDLTCTDSCGPFRISYGYWRAAFNRKENETDEYRKCTLNAWCATRTVQQYMKRFLPKCVRDRNEETTRSVCETALTLHSLGSYRCNSTVSDTYKQRLASCLDRRAWNWLTTDYVKYIPSDFF